MSRKDNTKTRSLTFSFNIMTAWPRLLPSSPVVAFSYFQTNQFFRRIGFYLHGFGLCIPRMKFNLMFEFLNFVTFYLFFIIVILPPNRMDLKYVVSAHACE